MKPRKKVSNKIRALLQKEVDSRCPFCQSEDVDTFEVHHLNGQPDNNDLLNLLLVCPTCHTKITSGTISINETYIKKYELSKKGLNLSVPASTPPAISLSNISGTTIIGNNNTIITRQPKTKAAIPTSDAIGNLASERSYISYLYNKLISFKSNIPKYNGEKAGSIVARKYRKEFGATWSNTPADRFDEAVKYLQQEIDKTPIAKRNIKNGDINYRSYNDFINKSF